MPCQMAEAVAARCCCCRSLQSECPTETVVSDIRALAHLTCPVQSMLGTYPNHCQLTSLAVTITLAACQDWNLACDVSNQHTNVPFQFDRSAQSTVFSSFVCLHRVCRSSGWRLSPCGAGISCCCTSKRSILRCSAATCKPGRHMRTGCPCSDSCCWNSWPSNRCVHPCLGHFCSAAPRHQLC